MFSNYIIIAVFCVVVILLIMYWYFQYHGKINVKIKEIETALNDVQQFNEYEYSLKFEEINRKLMDNQTIKAMWQDFSKNLTKTRSSDDQDELYSPVEARDFFRYAAVTKDLNHVFWQNFGSIFTGLGIGGTFLGLTIGLFGIDLSSSDVTVLKEGIGRLLSGISTAFFTSLVGILVALLYGGYNKWIQDKLAASVSTLAEQMEKMYPRKTVEQWLSDGQRESVEQTKAIKNLSQEMAERLGELLEQQMGKSFDEFCQTLEGQMKPVFEKLYNAISLLNEGGASAIAGVVSEKAGAQLDAFADVLHNLQETMQQSLAASEKTSTQANAMMIDTMRQIAASLTQGTEDAIKQQEEAASHMGEQMTHLVAAFQQSSEQAMQNMLTASKAAQQEMNASVEQTKSSAQHIARAMEEMTQRQSELLTVSVEATKQRVDETLSLMQKTIKESDQTLGQAYLAVKDMAQTVEGLLTKMQVSSEQMEHSVAPLTEAANALRQQLKMVGEHTERLHKDTAQQLDRLATQGSLTEKSLTRLSESVSAAEGKAVEAWNTYHDGLNSIGDELGNVLNSIKDYIAQYNQITHEGMKEQLKVFDDSMATAINQLKSAIDDLTDLVEDLENNQKGRP